MTVLDWYCSRLGNDQVTYHYDWMYESWLQTNGRPRSVIHDWVGRLELGHSKSGRERERKCIVWGSKGCVYFSGKCGYIQCIGSEAHSKGDTIFHVQILSHQFFQFFRVSLSAQFIWGTAGTDTILLDGLHRCVWTDSLVFRKAQVVVRAQVDRR